MNETNLTDSPGDEIAAGPRSAFDRLSATTVAVPLLIAYGAALFLLTLGSYPLYTKGEPREAETIAEIANGGSVILPLRAGIEVPSKPLLMHWTAALASVVSGRLNERVVRFPSAMFAIAGVLACFLYARLLFDPATALIAALMLGTSVQYLQAGTAARVDMTLSFFMEVAFFEFLLIAEGLTSRRMLLYVAIALAVLSKGPVGLVLPAATAFVFMAVRRRWELLRTLSLVRGAILVAMVAGSWYVAAIFAGGREFIDRQVLAENVFRFIPLGETNEGHAHPFYFLEFALIAGYIPWIATIPLVVVQAVRGGRKIDSRITYLIIWIAVVLVFYSFAQSKRGVYLLGLYPALATASAVYLYDSIRSASQALLLKRVTTIVSGIGFAGAGAAGIIAAAVMLSWPSAFESLLNAAGIKAGGFGAALRTAAVGNWYLACPLTVVCVIVGAMLIRNRASVERLVGCIATGFAAASIATNLVVLPALGNTLGLRRFAGQVMHIVGESPAAYLYGLNYGFAYYSGRNYPVVTAREMPSMPYLIAWTSSWDSLKENRRAPFEVVITSNPTELDGSDTMVLLRRRKSPPDAPAPAASPG
ncbi:MAG: ArnT family glycosyltransferase [Candidatus Binataceae bacterium]